MPRDNINDLLAFVAVASERSFTRAAARMGISQSALSHTIRRLETRLGLRLLTRTTRSVSPTEAGERLLTTIGPRFEEIEAELAALGDLRERPAGSIRITTSDHAAMTIIWPRLSKVLPDYPDLKVELVIDNGFTNIAAERFDAGVRLGESVEKDMIAVRIGPDMRLIAVASPGYFAAHEKPLVPQDLTAHRCINLRLLSSGGLYAWEFEKGNRSLRVRVDGQLTFSSSIAVADAALAGFGIGFVPEELVKHHLAEGRLIQVLDDWCQPFAGFHLYYPSRRQSSPAFNVIVDALRYRGEA